MGCDDEIAEMFEDRISILFYYIGWRSDESKIPSSPLGQRGHVLIRLGTKLRVTSGNRFS